MKTVQSLITELLDQPMSAVVAATDQGLEIYTAQDEETADKGDALVAKISIPPTD